MIQTVKAVKFLNQYVSNVRMDFFYPMNHVKFVKCKAAYNVIFMVNALNALQVIL